MCSNVKDVKRKKGSPGPFPGDVDTGDREVMLVTVLQWEI